MHDRQTRRPSDCPRRQASAIEGGKPRDRGAPARRAAPCRRPRAGADRHRHPTLLALALCALSIPSSGADAQTYAATYLSNWHQGLNIAQVNAINNGGQVTGYLAATTVTGAQAFVYGAGAAAALGTLGGAVSVGNAINASGQVTGYAFVTSGSGAHAFVADAGSLQDLGTLGGTTSAGNAINAAGQITGYAFVTADAAAHAFLYSNGAMRDLGTLGGTTSIGSGINATGAVTGMSRLAGDAASHAFVYLNGAMQDLGTLGGRQSRGAAINASGQVTGCASLAGDTASHAFLYTQGRMLDLGTLGGTQSMGLAINSAAQVVGSASVAGDAVNRAFLYQNGQMLDLNAHLDPNNTTSPGHTLVSAVAINDAGAILAEASNVTGGGIYWYLLQPVVPVAVSAQDLKPGQTTTLTATPTGSGPFTYQWYQGTTGSLAAPISGATSAGFTTPPLAADASYWVQVGGSAAATASGTITVIVVTPPVAGVAGDGPLPLWALGALAWALLGAAAARLRRE